MNPWTALTALLAVAFYSIASAMVGGRAEMDRSSGFRRNGLEWLVIFLPLLWIFDAYWSPLVGLALGVVWIVGGALDMTGEGRRGPGYLVQALVCLILLIGAAAGVVRALMVTA